MARLTRLDLDPGGGSVNKTTRPSTELPQSTAWAVAVDATLLVFLLLWTVFTSNAF